MKQLANFPPLSRSACAGLCKVNETVVFTLIDQCELSDIEGRERVLTVAHVIRTSNDRRFTGR